MESENRLRIIVLWMLFLFGMVFHSLLAMMPLFFGGSIHDSEAAGSIPPVMQWMPLVLYLLPMVIIGLLLFIQKQWVKITNFVFALLFTLMNIAHLVEHAGESPVDFPQVVLLTTISVFSIILDIISYRWIREK